MIQVAMQVNATAVRDKFIQLLASADKARDGRV
jgi:hypothetical protein